MELRHMELRLPWYWLARSGSGRIVGRAETDGSVHINSVSMMQDLESEHRFRNSALPYKTTYGTRLRNVQAIPDTPYAIHSGAIGIVKYEALPRDVQINKEEIDVDDAEEDQLSDRFGNFLENLGDMDGLHFFLNHHAHMAFGSQWFYEDLEDVLDKICLSTDLSDKMENDLDLSF
eukprot:7387693-Karenia_brevis.AAC.1